MKISTSPRKAAWIFLGVTLFLTLASCLTQWIQYAGGRDYLGGIIPLFNLDNEESIPTWVSSIYLLIASLLLGLIASYHVERKDRFAASWKFLSWLFLVMSVDEVACFHEKWNVTLRPYLKQDVFYFGWVLPAAIILFVLGITYFRFLVSLPRGTLSGFVVSSLFYVGGVLGMEMLDGAYAYHHGKDNLTYAWLTSGERGRIFRAFSAEHLYSDTPGLYQKSSRAKNVSDYTGIISTPAIFFAG